MNRDQTYKLILHIHGVFGLRRPPEPDDVDRWHHMLVDVDDITARRAVRDMAETDPGHAPTLAKMLGALHHPTERRPGPVPPLGQENCGMCDGTGLMLTRDPNEPNVDRMAPCNLCRPADYERTKAAVARHPAGGPVRSSIMDGAEERKAAWRRDRGKGAATGQRYTPHNRFRDDSTPPASVVRAGMTLIDAGDPDGMDVALDIWIDAGRPRDDAGLAGLDLIPQLLAPPLAGGDTYVAVLRRQFPMTTMDDPELRNRMARIKPLPGYGAHRPPDSPPAAS